MSKDLKMHKLQHSGKKSHSCNQCGNSSISAANMKIHMLIHGGEKPFTCKECNYSAYKQSDHCKSLHHLVKVVQAKKRFFECKKCKNRTYSFDKMPKKSCSNCQETSWIRVGMMRERKGPVLENEKLKIAEAENFYAD